MSKRLGLNEWSRAGLLRLPTRKWDAVSSYDSLLVLSTGKEHDSGWAVMAIIGVRKGRPVEIASQCCDDIEWKFPPMRLFGPNKEWSIGQLRTDCALKSGAVHWWTRDGSFRVGHALSSTTVELRAPEARVHPATGAVGDGDYSNGAPDSRGQPETSLASLVGGKP